jgi:hypothetical protein
MHFVETVGNMMRAGSPADRLGLFNWEHYLVPAYLASDLPRRWREHRQGLDPYCSTIWSTRCVHFKTADKVSCWYDGSIGLGAEPSPASVELHWRGIPRTKKAGEATLPLDARAAIVEWLQEHERRFVRRSRSSH